jgi:hypothetical protein
VTARGDVGEWGLALVVLVVSIVAALPDLGKVAGEKGVHVGAGAQA